jgi:hypothetical protein
MHDKLPTVLIMKSIRPKIPKPKMETISITIILFLIFSPIKLTDRDTHAEY